jgi:adenine/guanine phosphoribosyltransferase-like PRPP-binding protein
MTTKASDLIPQTAQDNAAPSQPQASTEQATGGSIVANLNQGGADLVATAAQNGAQTAVAANNAWAMGFAATRKAGTEEALEAIKAANQATSAAVAAINVDQIVAEATSGISPFSKGSLSLLG